MKTGRGWWALAGVVVLTMPGLYAGAYYALVTPFPIYDHSSPAYPRHWMRPFFSPIHQIDRRMRPKVWPTTKLRFVPRFVPENSN